MKKKRELELCLCHQAQSRWEMLLSVWGTEELSKKPAGSILSSEALLEAHKKKHKYFEEVAEEKK